MTVSCWRCGVDFDASQYIERSPCADCQLDIPGFEYRKFNIIAEAEEIRRKELVRTEWEQYRSDKAIAESLGLSQDQVVRTRRSLGLDGHTFTGEAMWKDPEAVKKRLTAASRAYWGDPNRKPRKAKRAGLLRDNRIGGKNGA